MNLYDNPRFSTDLLDQVPIFVFLTVLIIIVVVVVHSISTPVIQWHLLTAAFWI